MIDETELKTIALHGTMHKMGMCTCPCYEALLTVGRKLAVEAELRARIAEVSPEAIAAITIAARPETPPIPPADDVDELPSEA